MLAGSVISVCELKLFTAENAKNNREGRRENQELSQMRNLFLVVAQFPLCRPRSPLSY
jgi:hypothetical protein